MGKYFDFERPQSWSDYSSVGKSMSDMGDMMVKRRLDDQTLKVEQMKAEAYKAQVEATKAKEAQEERRSQVKFYQDQEDRLTKRTEDIGRGAQLGQVSLAQSIGAASRFEDPYHPGKMVGIGVTPEAPGPAPTLPETPGAPPVKPEAPVFPSPNEEDYYKTMSPEAARAQAISRAQAVKPVLPSPDPGDYQPPGPYRNLMDQVAGEQAAGVAERAQQAQAQYPGEQAAYETKKKNFEEGTKNFPEAQRAYKDKVARPNLILDYPTGEKTTLNPRELDALKEQQARDMAARLLKQADEEPMGPHSYPAMEARRRAADLLSGIGGADKTAISQSARDELSQKNQVLLQQMKDRSALIIANLKKKAGGAGGGKHGEAYFKGIAELIQMKIDAVQADEDPVAVNGRIAARAAELGIEPGGKWGWSGPVNEILRGESIGQRTGLRNQALIATDEHGNKVGEWKSPVEAKQGNQAEVDYVRVRDRLSALKDDITAYGRRVDPTDKDAVNRRDRLAGEVVTALRAYNKLSSTDASVQLEKEIQGARGTPGDGWLWGADPNVVGGMLEGAITWHRQGQQIRMKPGTFRESPGAPPAAGAAPAAATPPPSPGAAKAQAVAAPLTPKKGPAPGGGKLHDDGKAIAAARKILLKKPGDVDALEILHNNGLQK